VTSALFLARNTLKQNEVPMKPHRQDFIFSNIKRTYPAPVVRRVLIPRLIIYPDSRLVVLLPNSGDGIVGQAIDQGALGRSREIKHFVKTPRNIENVRSLSLSTRFRKMRRSTSRHNGASTHKAMRVKSARLLPPRANKKQIRCDKKSFRSVFPFGATPVVKTFCRRLHERTTRRRVVHDSLPRPSRRLLSL